MAGTEILVVTTDEVSGRSITRVVGLVRGNSVRARNVARDFQAGVRGLVGGRVGVYAELLEQSREEAIATMTSQARELGANAIVATRITTAEIMGGASEVRAYGTAVVIE